MTPSLQAVPCPICDAPASRRTALPWGRERCAGCGYVIELDDRGGLRSWTAVTRTQTGRVVVAALVLIALALPARAQLRGVADVVFAELLVNWLPEGARLQAALVRGARAIFLDGPAEAWDGVRICPDVNTKCLDAGELVRYLRSLQ